MNTQFKSIAERVTFARETLGVDKTQLAKLIGLSKQAISAIESGATKSPQPENLLAIADATGFELRWLISEEGPPTKKEAAMDRLDISKLSPANQAALRAFVDTLQQSESPLKQAS